MADTFADYLATGHTRGTAFVLVIEGCEFIFASEEACAQELADGRTIVGGLDASTVSIGESVYRAGAELNLTASTLSIVETSGRYRDAATRAFAAWNNESTLTWLDAALAVGGVTVITRSAAAIAVGRTIHLGTEAMRVTAKPIDNPAALTVTRAVWGTTEQAFDVEVETTVGLDVDLVPISAEPACYAGRRCWLYGRGLDELTDPDPAAGTLLWRGVLKSDPELDDDGITWQVGIGSRLDLFDGKVGSEKLAETQLRGIYYPDAAPFRMVLQRLAGAVLGGAFSDQVTVTVVGFFETQQAFCDELTFQTNVAMATLSYGGFCIARPVGDRWELFYTTASASPRYIYFRLGSPVDGAFTTTLYTAAVAGAVGVPTATLAASTEYRAGWNDDTIELSIAAFPAPRSELRKVPRALYMEWIGVPGGVITWPMGRWYLDRVAGYAVGGSLTITPPQVGEEEPEPLPTITVVSRGVEGYVEAIELLPDRAEWAAVGDTQPTIVVVVRIGAVTGCNVGDFIAAVVSTSPNVCNVGLMPFITDDDVDTAQWTVAVIAAANGRAALLFRDFSFGKPKKLWDILKQELRLLGLYPCLNAVGKIILRALVPDVDTPSFTIDEATHAPDGSSFGALKISPDGYIGSVFYKLGYDTAEDKHTVEREFVGRGIQAAVKGKAIAFEITPFTNPSSGRDSTDPSTHAPQAAQLLQLYGSRRYVYPIPVNMLCHELLVGDGALLTIKQMPFNGERGETTPGTGLVVTRGTVVGRSWAYGSEPRGTLTFEIHGLDIAGYAPTGRVASAIGATTAWTLTLEAARYGPGGAIADASFFLVGDRIHLAEWDDDTPTLRPGVVASVAGNNVGVTLDASWAGLGGAIYNLRLADSIDGISETEKRYAYIASTTGLIDYGSGNTRVARIFA